jgi:hypothetical protein
MNRTPRLEKAIAIRDRALKLIESDGRWEKTGSGPEIKIARSREFSCGLYVRPATPISDGLYSLDVWWNRFGKVLSLAWDSVGAEPKIISFKQRGAWKSSFLKEEPNNGN